MTSYYLKISSMFPEGTRPPGEHPDRAITRFEVQDGEDPPEEGLLGPWTEEQVTDYLDDGRPDWDESDIDHEEEQRVWHEAPILETVRADKILLIDQRTDALISLGFGHEGKQFSLSLPAQMKMIGTFSARSMVGYPIRWNTIDDLDVYEIQDAADVATMYGKAVEAVRVALDSGTLLKDQVRAATTVAEIQAIEDVR